MGTRIDKARERKRPQAEAPSGREQTAEEIELVSTEYRKSIVLFTANRLGIFDSLADRPASAGGLARRLGLSRRALIIMLDALAAMGLLYKRNGLYGCRPRVLPYLAAGGRHFFGDMLDHQFNSMLNWIHLPEVVRRGGPAGTGKRKRTAKEHREFIMAMTNIGRRSAGETLAHVDLSGYKRMLDLGGGPGTHSILFCKSSPGLRAVVFDLPQTMTVTMEEIKKAGMQDRIETAPGDFTRDPIGRGYDLVLVSSILHSLSHRRTAALLRKVHRAVEPGGLLIVKEFYIDESRTRPVGSALFAVNMLVSTDGGNCYTGREITDLMRKAGFTGIKSKRTAAQWIIYTGRKPRR